MRYKLEAISHTDTDYALELATLSHIAIFIGNERTRVVFEARLQRHLQTFEELITHRYVPINI